MKGILALTTSLILQNGDSKRRIIECRSRIKEGVLNKKYGLERRVVMIWENRYRKYDI